MTGCSVNSTFVYKPNTPVAGVQTVPVKVAVLPFKDGTENFTDRGSVFSSGQYNLAKAGVAATITALTPEMWAKSFADDLRTSGGFREARFVYTPSELSDEDLIIEGTVRKALAGKTFDDLNEFALSLRASTKSDKRLVWERDFTKAWNTPKNLYSGCGMGIQCSLDKFHGEYNTAMREIFAAARADLVSKLASLSGSPAGEAGIPPTAASPGKAPQDKGASPLPAPESAEQTIERILKEK